MATRLTKTIIDSATVTEDEGRKFFWDTTVKGFGIIVFPSGARTAILQFRTPERKTRRYTIGRLDDTLTLDQARDRARDLYRDVLNGLDPQGEKMARREALTVGELLDAYLKSARFAEKSPSTQGTDQGRIERHIRPLIGSRIADKLNADAIREMQKAIIAGKTAAKVKTGSRGLARVTGGAGTAAKAVLLMSAVYKWAADEGMLQANPAHRVKVKQAGRRTRIVTDAGEYARLFSTIERMEIERRLRPAVADAVRCIALTGARRNEIAALQWKFVDLRRGVIELPAERHKGGHRTGESRIIALPAMVQEIISRQPAGGPDDFVFRPAKGTGPLALGKPWRDIRKEAGLPEDLVLHGLRHSHGSHLAMAGASAPELMEALGHRQATTTMRYVHFAEAARRNLAERAAAVALAGMAEAEGRKKADVINLKK